MSLLTILLHRLRLRRALWAFATLNHRLSAYEQAYGGGAFRMTEENLRNAGLARAAD